MPVGLVLSGGGTRTDFQVGAVKYVLLRGVQPVVVCGVSGSAPNAAKLAEGEGTSALEAYWRGLRTWDDSFQLADWLQALSTAWQVVFVAPVESLMSIGTGSIASALMKAMGLSPATLPFDL